MESFYFHEKDMSKNDLPELKTIWDHSTSGYEPDDLPNIEILIRSQLSYTIGDMLDNRGR